jgi:myo-inositol 2-dehydrogenase / D-chiro-inositol 1-dehydrogenase
VSKPKSQSGISRRTFVKGVLSAGAVAGVPWVLPSRAVGAIAPSDRINVAMIGVGRQGINANLPPFLQSNDTQVTALCDVDSWRVAQALGRVNKHYARKKPSGKYNGCKTYGDFREVLARDDIDAVMISTPDHWHVPMSIAAVKSGKDVCCEKPLTLSIHEGRVLADTVKRYGRVFRTDSEFRSHWYFHRAVELVRNGRIGKLHTIRTGVPRGDIACGPQPTMPIPAELDYDMWLGPAQKAPYTLNRVHTPSSFRRPGWMRCRDYCDGMITNWGAHLVDICQWGNGTDRSGPVEVQATGTYPTDGLWNVLLNFEAKYKYADGVTLHYTMGRPFVRFEGEGGWIQADWGKGRILASSEALSKETLGPDDKIRFPLRSEKKDFIDCVKTRGRTLADAEVGHRTTSVCHLAHISIMLGGQALRWDPDAEQFINNDAANRLIHRTALRPPWTL